MDDAAQFALVQPVQVAGRAAFDDDVASAAVEVCIHGGVALGAGDAAVEFGSIGRAGNSRGRGELGAEFFDQVGEEGHADEHAVALFAVVEAPAGGGGVKQGDGAEGAGEVRCFVEDADAVFVFVGECVALAVVALVEVAIGIQVQGRAAVWAVHGSGFRWWEFDQVVSHSWGDRGRLELSNTR